MELLVQREKSNTIEDYEYIIEMIIKKYLEWCVEWDENCNKSINLNRKYIKDIYIDGELTEEFEKYLDIFTDIASEMEFEITEFILEEIKDSDVFKITSRVKTRESIMQKILKKMNEDAGAYQINKIINDIFGVRIIDTEFNEKKHEIEELLKAFKAKDYKIKNINRCLDTGYRGYHVYIRRDNYTFPIEIQFWDGSDERKNLDLHPMHKEDYLRKFVKEYNKY